MAKSPGGNSELAEGDARDREWAPLVVTHDETQVNAVRLRIVVYRIGDRIVEIAPIAIAVAEEKVGAALIFDPMIEGTAEVVYRFYSSPKYGRLQYQGTYSYLARNAWAGVGGAPKANNNMVFTGLRYYLP